MSDYPIGSTAEVFYDSDGNPCTLRQLVVSEPDWAVSRINHERRQYADLKARLAAAEADAVPINRQMLIDKFEALKTLHFDGDTEFDQGCRYAAKTIIGMLMTGNFDAAIDAARSAK